MSNVRLARLISHREHYKCEMCGKNKMGKMYEYQNCDHIPNFTPHRFKQICGDCIYREYYGSKLCRIKKREQTLDKM